MNKINYAENRYNSTAKLFFRFISINSFRPSCLQLIYIILRFFDYCFSFDNSRK